MREYSFAVMNSDSVHSLPLQLSGPIVSSQVALISAQVNANSSLVWSMHEGVNSVDGSIIPMKALPLYVLPRSEVN